MCNGSNERSIRSGPMYGKFEPYGYAGWTRIVLGVCDYFPKFFSFQRRRWFCRIIEFKIVRILGTFWNNFCVKVWIWDKWENFAKTYANFAKFLHNNIITEFLMTYTAYFRRKMWKNRLLQFFEKAEPFSRYKSVFMGVTKNFMRPFLYVVNLKRRTSVQRHFVCYQELPRYGVKTKIINSKTTLWQALRLGDWENFLAAFENELYG